MSNIGNTVSVEDLAEDPPDIFRAARNNDIDELFRAFADGQTLADRRPDLVNMCPLHLACLHSSVAFVRAAANHESFDPWLRDDNLRLPYDHASARNDKELQQIMYDHMYPPGWARAADIVPLHPDI